MGPAKGRSAVALLRECLPWRNGEYAGEPRTESRQHRPWSQVVSGATSQLYRRERGIPPWRERIFYRRGRERYV